MRYIALERVGIEKLGEMVKSILTAKGSILILWSGWYSRSSTVSLG
jgi:hypothetical protein